MAERIIMNEVKKMEWESMMSMTGNKLSKFNAIDQNLNCSQLMRNAGLDWTVSKVPVQATIDNETITSDKLYSLVKSDNNKILVSGLTDQYHTMQNEKLAQLGDYFSSIANVSFEHCFNYKDDKAITFLANTGGEFNILIKSRQLSAFSKPRFLDPQILGTFAPRNIQRKLLLRSQ